MMIRLPKHWAIVPLLLLLPLLFACQGAGTQSSAETTGEVDSEIPQAGTELELVLGPGSLYLEPHVGLAELSSYKATLTRSFDGSVAGQAQQWTETYVLQRDNAAAASLLTVEITGDISETPEPLIEVEGIVYVVGEDGECIADAVDPEISSIERLDPAGLLSGLLGAEEAGQETIDGVATDHYTFDERALAMFELAKSSGEIWVASDGGHILKYLLTTTGSGDAFGEGIEGSMIWDYTLTDIDLPVTLDIPQDCVNLMISAPRLADASNVSNTPGWLTYDTAASVAEASAFYQEQMAGLGWTTAIQSLEDPTVSYLEYTQGDQTLSITILAGDEGTKVDILLTSPEDLP